MPLNIRVHSFQIIFFSVLLNFESSGTEHCNGMHSIIHIALRSRDV